jgi:hypothetical protein
MATAEYHRKWRERRGDLQKVYARNWYAKNKERAHTEGRVRHLRRKYGVTEVDVDTMTNEQLGRCAICRKMLLLGGGTHIDHDHETQRVRGLLCVKCNNGLGQFNDQPHLLRSAAAYLESARQPVYDAAGGLLPWPAEAI